ncbi:MAG TPA: TonB-dependent receptor, partial [Saprospiraceae bacterium]|nr:TonB-dependent receptor [Saprospiraceae bacterium]
MEYQLLKTEQKALEINLNTTIYGTFAEIGAGQEVARNFFQAGAAANTIAKTMSAYDKTYSDAIYGSEASGRYVCESRVYKMLDHEWQLLDERLKAVKPTATFFAFSDSVTTINYSKTVNGQGWLG